MGMMEAVKTCFQKFFTFSGRARRAEYWWFTLFNAIVGIALGVIGFLIGHESLSNYYSYAVTVPAIAVTARRLHDIDRTAWWLLLALLPLVLVLVGVAIAVSGGDPMLMYLGLFAFMASVIVIFIFTVMRGTDGPNRFGEDPITGSPEQVF